MVIGLVAAVVLGGCGSSDDGTEAGTGAKTEAAQGAAPAGFCDAWLAVLDAPSAQDADAATAATEDIERLVEVTPADHRAEVEAMATDWRTVTTAMEAAGWSEEAMGGLPGDQLQGAIDAVHDLSAFEVSDVAFYAHDTCEGVDDPSFTLGCIEQRKTMLGGQAVRGGRAVGGWQGAGGGDDDVAALAGGDDDVPFDGEDPLADAEEHLASVEGAVAFEHQEVDGTLQIAFVDADGRAVELVELTADGDGWASPTISACA